MRERMLEAALRSFDERGLMAATIDDIRRAAGVSVGSVYHHFGDKEGIAAALWVDCMRSYQEAFVAELVRHTGAREGVEGVVRFHLAWCAGNRQRARFLQQARPADAAELREINRRFFAAVEGWLRPHVHYGAIRELPFDVMHALWLGPAHEYSRHWLAGRSPAPDGDVVNELAESAWKSLEKGESE